MKTSIRIVLFNIVKVPNNKDVSAHKEIFAKFVTKKAPHISVSS